MDRLSFGVDIVKGVDESLFRDAHGDAMTFSRCYGGQS
jgi:hypothetical protein